MTMRSLAVGTVALLASLAGGRWTSAGRPQPTLPPAVDPAIVFVDGGGYDLVVMDADGSGRTTILKKPKGNRAPMYLALPSQIRDALGPWFEA